MCVVFDVMLVCLYWCGYVVDVMCYVLCVKMLCD